MRASKRVEKLRIMGRFGLYGILRAGERAKGDGHEEVGEIIIIKLARVIRERRALL